MLIAITVSISIIAYSGYSNTQKILIDRLQTSELPNLVQRIEQSISSEIKEMKVLTHSIATNSFILEWLDKGESEDGEKSLIQYLTVLAEKNGLNNVSFADRETNKYWNQKGFLRTLQNDNLDSWFFSFKDSGNAESASTYTYPEGNVDIFVNFQQLNGRGASGVSKSFDDIANFLLSFKIEQTGFVYLVDSDGLIKVHKNRAFTEKKNVKELYTDIDFKRLFSKQDFAFQSFDQNVISTSYVESLGWYIIAEVPKSELYSGLDESRQFTLIAFALVTLIFTGISIVLANRLVLPLKDMAVAFQELGKAGGDLTYRVSEDGAKEITDLARGFNNFVANIRNVVEDVTETSTEVRNVAASVYTESSSSKSISDQQRQETYQVSVAINEIGATISEIANNANVAEQTTNSAAEMTIKAKQVVNQSTKAINSMAQEMVTVSANIESLAKKANNISSVLEVISGISEQTNLLALNAAIEAARAGEQGRGFAVVADEVRNLAKRTNESTDEIRQMIVDLQQGAKLAVDSVRQSSLQANQSVESADVTNDVLEQIVSNVQNILDLNAQIATATEEQSAVIREINVHVVNINDSTEQNSQIITSIEFSSEKMSTMASKLDQLMGRFKI
jgi:methyl-accepting chemotaxis protein